jgi:hypothetical protein
LKNIFRTGYYLAFCLLLIACNPMATASTPTQQPEPTLKPDSTATLSATATAAVTATITPTSYQEPTPIPTIEPAKIPELLKNSFSIQTLSAFNGHNLQRITGWSNGFNGGLWDNGSRSHSQGYLWLDSSHLLLFAATGETFEPNWSTISASPVVMNLDSGTIWLPPNDRSSDSRWFSIMLPRWSPKLKLLVTAEKLGEKEGVSTFGADGKRMAHYDGLLEAVSPSAERIFMDGDTWLDLGSGKNVNFGWGPGFGYDNARWLPIWSRDESQVYFCCYFYGNAKTGKSYTITNEKTIFDGGPSDSLRHAYGTWLNDHVVMADYDAWWYEGPGFSAIFDIREKTYHNLGLVAGLPDAFNDNHYSRKSISPNGDYMYISLGGQSPTNPQTYLVDLRTLKAKLYHDGVVEWSANGKYALVESQVLNLSTKTSRPLPARPDSQGQLNWIAEAWHPIEGVRLSIYLDKQQHMVVNLLDVEKLTYRHLNLPFNFNITDNEYRRILWAPKGDRFVLKASDGSLWQMDYPKFENLEQLSAPIANVKDISWSPDGKYLSYLSGTDIYIVDTSKTP